jgi:hypothetical protein
MTVELWFLATLVIAQLYDLRAGKEFDKEIGTRQLGYGMAFLLGAVVAVSGLFIYSLDLSSKLTYVQDKRSLVVLIGGLMCFRLAHLGLRYWFPSSWPQWPGYLAAFILTACFFSRPTFAKPQLYNNILLVVFSVGIGCYVGRWASKRFAYLFYLLLALYDGYAVWYSNIMEKMIENAARIDVFPIGFLIMSVSNYGLGAGDVIFGTMGAMIIKRYAGTAWSLVACLLYYVSMDVTVLPLVSQVLKLMGVTDGLYFPLMVTISPITIACLWLGSRSWRKSSTPPC